MNGEWCIPLRGNNAVRQLSLASQEIHWNGGFPSEEKNEKHHHFVVGHPSARLLASFQDIRHHIPPEKPIPHTIPPFDVASSRRCLGCYRVFFLRYPCVLWVDAADVGTLLIEGALAALWPLGMADLATVADQAHVQAVDPVGWGDFGEDDVSLVGVHLRADEAQALADPMNMGVYRPLQLYLLNVAFKILSMLSRSWLKWIYSFVAAMIA